MSVSVPSRPATLGLFEKRISGDDSLLDLAQLRFREAGMGAEIHVGSPEHLDWMLGYRPSPSLPVVAHLPRDCHLPDPQCQNLIETLAGRAGGRVLGFVVHDHRDMVERRDEFVRAAEEAEMRLRKIEAAPLLFIEYAVGLGRTDFAEFFEAIRELRCISACIDIGHVGIRQARDAYSKARPGQDICALKSQPGALPELMEDVQQAVRSALPEVVSLIERIGKLGKPLHFHLHDGHPLSTFSPFGVSDHLSFLSQIPIGFDFQGRRTVPLLFGRSGLAQVVATAIRSIGARPLSFTLEIHPTFSQLALGGKAALFDHWRDKTHAEQMNHWLEVLADNHALLSAECRRQRTG